MTNDERAGPRGDERENTDILDALESVNDALDALDGKVESLRRMKARRRFHDENRRYTENYDEHRELT
ncbi:hypothetical protein [Halococcus sediminicola]|uniref:hypothetical protein n=1 Tax=Halococcus sediminicola TaxID=1264579 RepID=UPI000679A730|nr:hypothetical protein [Halococcus sediminicola]